MRVLAIDPGFDRVGVAILQLTNGLEELIYSTCIETDRSDALPTRITAIGTELTTIISRYEPTALAIESLFFNQNTTTALAVAQVRGVIIYLAKHAGCAIYEFNPQEVKIAVTGYGKSDKAAVMAMVQRLVPAAPETAKDDEFDAIAVGITCLAHHGRTQ